MRSRREHRSGASGAFVWSKATTWVSQVALVRTGDLWAADDPIVLANPDVFTDDPQQLGMVHRSQDESVPAHVAAAAAYEQVVAARAEAELTGGTPERLVVVERNAERSMLTRFRAAAGERRSDGR